MLAARLAESRGCGCTMQHINQLQPPSISHFFATMCKPLLPLLHLLNSICRQPMLAANAQPALNTNRQLR